MNLGRPRSKGAHYEDLALDYLESRGLVCIQRNFSCRLGELDLIMRDRDCLVMVEVRYRASRGYGGAAASVDQRKQDKLKRAALAYLQQAKLNSNNINWRFDVVSIEADGKSIQWIANAFC